MSWSTYVQGTPEEIERLVADVKLPEHAEQTENHKKQLHNAKSAALHLVNLLMENASSFDVSFNGHDWTHENAHHTSVGVGVTVHEIRVE